MGVGEIVGVVPCCGMGSMAHIASGVRPSCVRSLALRPRLGRGVDCAMARGLSLFFLPLFSLLVRVSRFMVPNNSASHHPMWLM